MSTITMAAWIAGGVWAIALALTVATHRRPMGRLLRNEPHPEIYEWD